MNSALLVGVGEVVARGRGGAVAGEPFFAYEVLKGANKPKEKGMPLAHPEALVSGIEATKIIVGLLQTKPRHRPCLTQIHPAAKRTKWSIMYYKSSCHQQQHQIMIWSTMKHLKKATPTITGIPSQKPLSSQSIQMKHHPTGRMFRALILSSMILLPGLSQYLRAERSETLLVGDWRFQQGYPQGAETMEIKDSDWETANIPHTWNHTVEPQAASAKNRYRRGPGWYRRTLKLPQGSPGERTFLCFEAASLVADVYLNGTKLGQHRGGFTAFTFEITAAMKSGTNLLAVRVDNSRFDDIALLSGDFTVF